MRLQLVVVAILFFQSGSYAMNLNEYLNAVAKNHKTIQSLEASKEASDFKKEAGDIDLVPELTANYRYSKDKGPLNQWVSFGAEESKVSSYGLGLNKRFSSGTGVRLSANAYDYENPGLGTSPLFADFEKYSTGSLGISLSQDLWKDFFGHAIRLRWEREDFVNKNEKGGYDLQIRTVLAGAEAAFWDYIYWTENRRIAKDSLDRSKKIESWVKRRSYDGISDKADLYEAQALVGSRQLATIGAEDELAAARRKVRDYLELAESDPMPDLAGDIGQTRTLASMVGATKGKIVAIDAYLASLTAKSSETVALEVKDANRPTLQLVGAYNTNAKEPTIAQATTEWTKQNKPTMFIGIDFRYAFDTDVKTATVNKANKDALAAKLQSERKMMESDSSWIELNRRYADLTSRIESASSLLKIQSLRSKAQSDKFNKGRSITSDVVNAEQDVALAELNVMRLKSDQRKMEAQGRLYIAIEE
jgi:outer membrane protein TolC